VKQTEATCQTVVRCLEVLEALPASPTVVLVRDALRTEKFERLWDGSIPFPSVDLESFPVDYFAYNLLRKYPFKGVDRKAVALKAFADNEGSCRSTNERLKHAFRTDVRARDLILSLRAKIGRVLGRFHWDYVERDFAWGPGATTRLANSEGDVYFKFRGKPETTLNNFPLAVAAIGRIPIWFGDIHPLVMSDMAVVVAGSKVTTVPKDAKTDRTIAIEPCMNMFVQRGIGKAMRRRLLHVGVDLNDQCLNQELASRAYAQGLATLDISAASDSVSSELVELLMPEDWLSALKQCRSSRYVLNSRIETFEKFSTMGNGYTFELESLIFWAIVSHVVDETFVADRTIGVYGDDIICHAYCFDRLVEVLNFCGFTTNEAKSYSSGPFYESCGKHYFHGSDVTPVFVKDSIVRPDRTAWWSNSILRWLSRIKWFNLDGSFQVWQKAVKHVDKTFQFPIPEGIGDGGVVRPYVSTLLLPGWLQSISSRGKLASDYQHGVDFTQFTRVERHHFDRDPSDVPYLLRGLYRLEAKPVKPVITDCRGDEVSSAVMKSAKWVKTSGWTSSWVDLVI